VVPSHERQTSKNGGILNAQKVLTQLSLLIFLPSWMPPRKGIVKSGNVGNSSKAPNPQNETSNSLASGTEKPLFPLGSKYPLNLLHERYCNIHFRSKLLALSCFVARPPDPLTLMSRPDVKRMAGISLSSIL